MYFTAPAAKEANYVCATIAIVILLTRLIVSRVRRKPLDASFFLVVASICTIAARLAVNYYYLQYGTAADAVANNDYFNTHDASHIKEGSILSLIARVLIATTCWLQICLLLLFYSRLLDGVRWTSILIRVCWVTVGTTYVAIILSTFLECRPFRLYWQVHPDPGKCVHAYAQLLVQCISNVVIDLMLLVIGYPLLVCRGRSVGQYLRVGMLLALGLFSIVVTILRVVSIYQSGSAQPTRSFWASVQGVTSAFVANMPTIYGDMVVQRRKRSEALIRKTSRADEGMRKQSVAESGESGLLTANEHNLPERGASVTNDSSARSAPKEWYDRFEEDPD